ncbi:sacsin N-terminal ATP-binding-like domain-containing protein [Streptomyces sp. JJ36]|uniref:sacsin N-terminal ATP-binding-like domain-containing protein n=1 Tax=Streptomyces sp. JJ36 TaxID=2736645 RepID=UPI001F169D38|nr:molecular chaperone Hsp90 [Streptomyces sp. JJ36]MCF6525484.1 molecular chaperone Hsp90 [Streptomyces sp. JJ36]
MVRQGSGEDPFGTARLRHGVLDAWAASPARFREDANAEQDLALGGYRDRLVVELAQNAADAAARAGVPGRVRLVLRDGVLVAANTGAPLDEAGVESLSTLRASAKRDESAAGTAAEGPDAPVGRFGVGFSAVLAVTDEPAVLSRTGGVRWSLAEARELVREAAARPDHPAPALLEEVRRREGHVPLLRLPLSAEGAPPEGYDTAVVLPLRDGAAQELADRLLAAVDDALLLTLPGLTEVVLDTPESVRTLTRRAEGRHTVIDDATAPAAAGSHPGAPAPAHPEGAVRHHTTRWRVAAAGGRAAAELFADRPVEERLRPWWSVTWAVPVDAEGAPVRPSTAPVVHAPTPTDEPLGVPALLVASFPLEPTRRHVALGPLADFLLERAAETYTELLRDWEPPGYGTVDLVPGPLGRSELDGELRRLLLERLPRVPFLPSAAAAPEEEGGEGPDAEAVALRPRDAELVEGAGAETVRVLAELFPSLLPAGLERRAELRALEVARVPLGEAIDRLAGVEREAAWWRRLYDALAGVDPDRLTGLPVPLADGRTVVGPRHVLLPAPGEGPEAAERHRILARLGLKVAHPDAVHPLLEKLGATPATPRAVLTTPQVRAAVAASLDAEETWDEDDGTLAPEELAETVLTLVGEAGLGPGDEPWLGALALPDEEGELAPAGELVLPGSPFAEVIREGELPACDAGLVSRWGEQPLTAAGVLAGFALVRATDVVLDPDELVEPREGDFAEPDDTGLLDAVDVWCEDALDALPETPVPPVAAELVAVRDLDLVDDDKWPQALAMLSRPPLRDALTQPVRVLLPDGGTETVRPYTAWWLRGHPVLDGRRPAGLRAAGADPLLDGLYEEADASALTAPGGGPDEQVLRALGVRTSAAALLGEPGGAAELLARLADPESPVEPGQLHGLYSLLAELDPEEITLPDELRAVTGDRTRVVDATEAVVADAPDLVRLAGDRPLLPVRPALAAALAAVLDVPRLGEALPGEVSGDAGTERSVPEAVRELLPGAPERYVEHDELYVDGVEADWRRTPDGTLHAATLEGLAAGLAWAAGRWARRFETAALLEDPSRAAELARARWHE